MTKNESKQVGIGTRVRSIAIGIEHECLVEEIILTGPRPPYFVIRGIKVSYRDVAFAKHKMPRKVTSQKCRGIQ